MPPTSTRAYCWHFFLIIAIQKVFLGLPLPPFVKFLSVTAIGVPFVFLWSWMMRRIRVVRNVLLTAHDLNREGPVDQVDRAGLAIRQAAI